MLLESVFQASVLMIKMTYGVLATIGVVDLLVRTHDRAGTSSYGISEWPKIEFMHGNVVDVGAQSLCDIKPVPLSFRDLSKTFLLIGNIMLRACSFC